MDQLRDCKALFKRYIYGKGRGKIIKFENYGFLPEIISNFASVSEYNDTTRGQSKEVFNVVIALQK